MIWEPDPDSVKPVFEVQLLTGLALYISGIVFGTQVKITRYHATLLLYLASGGMSTIMALWRRSEAWNEARIYPSEVQLSHASTYCS